MLLLFVKEKKLEENLEDGYEYSDYILLRDLRNGRCLQQLWVVIYIRHYSYWPLESSPETQRPPSLVSGCSSSFVLRKSNSSDAERVFQTHTHKGHQHSQLHRLPQTRSCLEHPLHAGHEHAQAAKSPPLFSQQSLELGTDSTHSTQRSQLTLACTLVDPSNTSMTLLSVQHSWTVPRLSYPHWLVWLGAHQQMEGCCSMLISHVLHSLACPPKHQPDNPAQTHNLLLDGWWHKFFLIIDFYFCLWQIWCIITYYFNLNLKVLNPSLLSKLTDTIYQSV